MKSVYRIVFVLPFLVGCGEGKYPEYSADAGIDLSTATCSRACEPGCLSGFTCVVPNATAQYAAFCAPPCSTDSDCGALRCAQLFNQPGAPRVCVAVDVPSRCPGLPDDPTWHCDFPLAICDSAKVLRRGFSQPSNRVCGTEYVSCPAGCEQGGDGGVAAHCR